MKTQNFQRGNLKFSRNHIPSGVRAWECVSEAGPRGPALPQQPHPPGLGGQGSQAASARTPSLRVIQSPGAAAGLTEQQQGMGSGRVLHAPPRNSTVSTGPETVAMEESGCRPRAPSCLSSQIPHLDPRSLLLCKLRNYAARPPLKKGRRGQGRHVSRREPRSTVRCPQPNLPTPGSVSGVSRGQRGDKHLGLPDVPKAPAPPMTLDFATFLGSEHLGKR